jgi:hypothetical protein
MSRRLLTGCHWLQVPVRHTLTSAERLRQKDDADGVQLFYRHRCLVVLLDVKTCRARLRWRKRCFRESTGLMGNARSVKVENGCK